MMSKGIFGISLSTPSLPREMVFLQWGSLIGPGKLYLGVLGPVSSYLLLRVGLVVYASWSRTDLSDPIHLQGRGVAALRALAGSHWLG